MIPIKDFTPSRDTTYTYPPEILGFRTDGIAIVPVYDDYKAKTVDFYMVDIDEGRVLPDKHHVILPKGAHIMEMSLSHAGNRIAWLFSMEVNQVAKNGPTKEYVLDVWLSDADGSDLKRVTGFTPHATGDASN